MIPLSSVKWGPIDAVDADKDFRFKWMKSRSIEACLQKESWIVSGEKGVGKTAIRRAIVEIYGDGYLSKPVVDFNEVSFRQLYDNLLQFARMTQLSKSTILSNFWQYAILVELIKNCAAKAPLEYGDLVDMHDRFMDESANSGALAPRKVPNISDNKMSLPHRLLTLMESLWNTIDDYTRDATLGTSKPEGKPKNIGSANLIATSGLTSRLISEMKTYPINSTFDRIRGLFFERLSQNRHRVILLLDGFDKLRTDDVSADAVDLIFESLVDAVQSIHSYRDLPEGFEIKAFIPHDRYLSITLRDLDKVDTMHVAIRWDRADLQEFLRKRLELTPKLNAESFQSLWREVMPETVTNTHYKIAEDSFDYLVRHTMMRPRQLQIHLEQLAKHYHGQTIGPAGVTKSIADSCKALTRHFITEFKIDHPNLDAFIGSLHGKDNVMEFESLVKITQDALKRFERGHARREVLTKIDTLYAMGLFGVVHFIEPGELIGDVYCPPTKESRRHYVEFFYNNPHPSITSMLDEESVVAFHPIFLDYANLNAHPTLIVG